MGISARSSENIEPTSGCPMTGAIRRCTREYADRGVVVTVFEHPESPLDWLRAPEITMAIRVSRRPAPRASGLTPARERPSSSGLPPLARATERPTPRARRRRIAPPRPAEPESARGPRDRTFKEPSRPFPRRAGATTRRPPRPRRRAERSAPADLLAQVGAAGKASPPCVPGGRSARWGAACAPSTGATGRARGFERR